MRFLRLITAIFVVTILLFGCAATSTGGYRTYTYRANSWGFTTGKVRPVISPDEVKFYSDPPSEYETIAIIEACCAKVENGWVTQERQNAIIKELKEQAAKVGANGVLWIDIGTTESTSGGGSVSDGGGSVSVSSYTSRTVKGRAIYVFKEEPIKEPVRDTASLPEDNHEAAAPPDSAKEEVEASP